MREVFRHVVPDVPVLDGTAEDLPLPDSFADAIVCAQAFHWFRPRATLQEFARVLRPHGGVGLVWNTWTTRAESVSWWRRVWEVADRYHRKERSRVGWRPWKKEFGGPSSRFGPLRLRTFPSVQRAPVETFLDRVLSTSSVAVQSATERRRVAREVCEILRTDPLTRGRRLLRLPMVTEVYWARLR
jgi:SAM-dependent methyltransferase